PDWFNSSLRIFPGRVVAYRKGKGKRRLIWRGAEKVVQPVEHVFIRHAPGTDKLRILECRSVVQLGEPITQKKAFHVVEVSFATINEARPIIAMSEQLCQSEEIALGPRQSQHGIRDSGGEARAYCFGVPLRSRASRVSVGEVPANCGKGVKAGREVGSARGADIVCAKAFLHNQDDIERFCPSRSGVLLV